MNLGYLAFVAIFVALILWERRRYRRQRDAELARRNRLFGDRE